MRIVVTGGGGFVGRALVGALAGRHDVIALDTRLGGLPGVEGDLSDPAVIRQALAGGCDAVVHLATVPGGAAEQNPPLAKQINIDATMALVDAVASTARPMRFVFASSIAVFGDPMPAHVDDDTPLAPKMLYGAHKAMMEEWIATQTRRGALSGISLRLPGIVARPRGPSGMKSAFMSDIFHAIRAGEPIALPVSPQATLWLMSVERIACNLVHALESDGEGALTLPAVRTSMASLADAICRATGQDQGLVSYSPDPALEAGFGRQPPLSTPRAQAMGFAADASVDELVASALRTLG